MNQISIALLCTTLIAISACSDSKEETTSNNTDTSTSEQDLSDAATATEEVIEEVSVPTVDVSGFEIQGIKLGMSESEVMTRLERTCNNGTPFWTKEEEKDRNGVYFRTVFTCPRDSSSSEGFLSVTVNNTVNGITLSRTVLEKEKDVAHETLVSLADKAKEKYGEPIFESINEGYSSKKFYIGGINNEMSFTDQRKRVIQCWADCVIERDQRYDEVVIMNTVAPSFAMTITPTPNRGLNPGLGVEVNQYLFDFPAQREAYKVYQEKADAAQEAQEAAEKAAEQEAAKKVEL